MIKIFIANRGEIATRIIRTCKHLGISTVAIYSTVDKNAVYVQQADESYCLGEPNSSAFLNFKELIRVAKTSSCTHLHPGYGFLSENADFAQAVADAGLVFIGPSPSAIKAVGSKIRAKKLVRSLNMPDARPVPGYDGSNQSIDILHEEALKVGFPLLIKASAGGGGRGMRVVRDRLQLRAALEAANREAKASFGDGALLVERYIEHAKHIEVQVLGDHYGNIVHLFERECTVQRRHQKIVEESPSPCVDSVLRNRLCAVAVAIARAVDYRSAGTVEFVLDCDTLDGDGANVDFFFLEVNARIQVEHGITEMVTGIDLVAAQIGIACERSLQELDIVQERINLSGHSIECRLNAEDCVEHVPQIGHVSLFHAEEEPLNKHIRYDSGICSGSDVTVNYDSMLAKVIVFGHTRDVALQRMRNALQHTVLLGVRHNIPLLLDIVQHDTFVQNRHLTTHFLAQCVVPTLPKQHIEQCCASMATLGTMALWARRNCVRAMWRNVHTSFRFGQFGCATQRQLITVQCDTSARDMNVPHNIEVSYRVQEEPDHDKDGEVVFSYDTRVCADNSAFYVQSSGVGDVELREKAVLHEFRAVRAPVVQSSALNDNMGPLEVDDGEMCAYVDCSIDQKRAKYYVLFRTQDDSITCSVHALSPLRNRVTIAHLQCWSRHRGRVALSGNAGHVSNDGSYTLKNGVYQMHSPMPGKIVRVCVKHGDSVQRGDELFIVESMKMERVFVAPCAGRIECENGASVAGTMVKSAEVVLRLVPAK